jgi:MFS family permease
LAIFFAFYIASEVPSNLLIKKISPRIWLGILTMVWGVIGMAMGFVKNYTGMLVVRAFLGTSEGGLLPGIVLYLSMMYRRQEIGLRLGIIYSAASLSGAFGGLLGTPSPLVQADGQQLVYIKSVTVEVRRDGGGFSSSKVGPMS